ncbi:hypothetical protein ACIOFV_07360 [Streptomyces mirabilis]
MSAETEQERARQAYGASREQRESGDVQRAQDNARIDGSNTSGSNPGGAR